MFFIAYLLVISAMLILSNYSQLKCIEGAIKNDGKINVVEWCMNNF